MIRSGASLIGYALRLARAVGVTPDLCTFGKAVVNGYPMGAIGGLRRA